MARRASRTVDALSFLFAARPTSRKSSKSTSPSGVGTRCTLEMSKMPDKELYHQSRKMDPDTERAVDIIKRAAAKLDGERHQVNRWRHKGRGTTYAEVCR